MISTHLFTYSPYGFARMHLAAFDLDGRKLRSRLGLRTRTTRYETLADLPRAITEPTDIALLITDWRYKVDELRAAFDALRAAGARKVVYFDTFDQSCSPYFGLAPHVDLYLKSKMLRPVELYQTRYSGGSIVTDYCEKHLGFRLGDWNFGSELDPAYAHRVASGWNFGAGRRCRVLLGLARLLQKPLAKRPLHLHSRVAPRSRECREWYEEYRAFAARAVSGLPHDIRVTAPGRVSQRQYLRELLASRMVFSPFGWGEVCLRDYEAVACGCLLVKPDMEHMATQPDIFVPHETYVPIKWDFSDLAETCRRYLDDTAEAQRIATNGRQRLHDYYRRGGFVRDVGAMVDALELGAAPNSSV